MEIQTREQIKVALFELLAREDLNSIKFASTCLAAIGALEIPLHQWDNLIETLCNNAQSDSLYIRMASLQTLGYLSEDLDPSLIPASQMNEILYALLTNMNAQQLELTKISVEAFKRTAPYLLKNFQVPEQCDFIMK